MFAQPSRSNLASPMSVPQGSPRQSSGMGGKGGPSQSSPGGMGGKGGGSPQGMGGPTVGISSRSFAPGSSNLTLADVQNARPMGQMLPPPQLQTQPMPLMPPSIPAPSPQIPIPQSPAVMPQLPPGLMQRLQSFRGF